MRHLRNLFTLLMLLCTSMVFSQTFEVDGICYNVLDAEAKTVEVTSKTTDYSGDIVIPATVEYEGASYDVVQIGSSAFQSDVNLSSVVIPEGVKTIGGHAFAYAKNMKSVIIPEGVETIGGHAFTSCIGLQSITIPSTVTSIGSYAFQGISGHLYVNCNIPNPEGGYYNSAFYECNFSGVTFGDKVTSIGNYAFYSCNGLTSLVIPKGVTTIGAGAFGFCRNIESVVISEGVTTIGESAFQYCSGVSAWSIPSTIVNWGQYPFERCLGKISINCNIPDAETFTESIFCETKFSEVIFGDKVESIGNLAFYLAIKNGGMYYHDQLQKVTFGKGLKRIGDNAFRQCKGITSVTIPESVTSIGSNNFSYAETIQIEGSTPATITETSFNSDALLYVPDDAFVAYSKADVWKGYNGLTCDKYDDLSIESYASGLGVIGEIGDNYVRAVVKLKVKGTIDSYDMIVFRDKTPTLRELDLSETTVVACTEPFYKSGSTQYCTEDNVLGAYAFHGLDKLRSLKLPKNLLAISYSSFYKCTRLEELIIPTSVKSIGATAFFGCKKLKNIIIPQEVITIENRTFEGCESLESVEFPYGIKNIEEYAFCDCNLKKIIFPPTLIKISQHTFQRNRLLEEIRLPSSVQSIGSYAFDACDKLLKVYTYTVEPTSITENTFSTFDKATLYVPKQSYYNYYWNVGWKRFLSYEWFDEPYEYFYVNNDYTLNDDTGYIEGVEGENPDADINAGGGLVVEGEQTDDEEPNQSLGDVNVNTDENGNSGCIIGDNNLHIDNLHIKINVKGGRWYFFAFPFDIKLDKISMENGSNYVFRYYDGEERANNGKNGWKNVNGNKLNAAQGYIFQCSADDVLVLDIENIRFKKEDKYTELVAHVGENLKDASWNFVGNPYLSYYDMADMNYSAPVTIWDGSKYVAIRPGDDDYHFAPYEAFFVQKPENCNSLGFDGEQQMTNIQSETKKEEQYAARIAMVSNARTKENPRKLINLTLTCDSTSDVTRIVFNNAQSLAYEADCDAAKFETQGVIQLYSLGEGDVRYAINERPEDKGVVRLGYAAPTEGVYTLEAVRMDADVYVKDLKTGILHDLSKGAYTFTTDGGTYVNRLEILTKDTVTAIGDIDADESLDSKQNIYDMSGRRVKESAAGVYVVDGKKTVVK